MNLEHLLQRHEGKTLDFKRDLSSPAGVIKTVVAFANTAGGDVVVGVDDQRSVVGVEQPLDEEERLANLIADRIYPVVVADIEVVPWRSSNVLVAHVPGSPIRPHHVVSEGPEVGVYVRLGSTSRRADPAMIVELKRYRMNRSFDEDPLPELNSEAIDFRVASESFADIRKLKPGDLRTLRILTEYQDRLVPTVGGVILFGANRLELFPDAWIRVGLFGGRDRTRILDDKEVTSPLPQAVEEAMSQVTRMTSTSYEIRGARREPRPTYPIVAIREAVVNATVHADYAQRGSPITVSLFADRIEIQNPGVLPLGLTLDDIRDGASKLRNRVIGRVFKELGLIEQWGSGIQRMTQACMDAGLAAPLFEELATGFRVTIRSERTGTPRTDPIDAAILDSLIAADRAGGLATSDVAEALGLSDRTIRTRLLRLADRGSAVRIGSSRNDPKARWKATDRDLPGVST